MRGLVLGLLCVCVSAQLDRAATEYIIEGAKQPPLVQDALFTTQDTESEKRMARPYANLIVGIMSSPDHFAEREAVRASWIQLQSLTDPKLNRLSLEDKEGMVIRFVIGKAASAATELAIAKESLKYHDIVRVPVAESYFNLTSKTGEFMKWADSTFSYKWVMKCDDDSFVRVDLILQDLMKEPSHAENLYMGKMWTGTPVDRRVDKQTPWKQHHTFAAGAGYILSSDLAGYIVRNLDNLHLFPFEDVAVGSWLSGIHVNYVDHPHFHSLPEGCDKDMRVQNPAEPRVMRETFMNSVKGIPCHADPDPFDPVNKKEPDHVLMDLGIPKEKPDQQMGMDAMMMAGTQNLLSLQHEEEEQDTAGMPMDAMNSNQPSASAVMNMNRAESPEVVDTPNAVDQMNAVESQ